MPMRTPHICGCGHRVVSGARCPCQVRRDAERKARHDQRRPNATQRGYDRTWEREAKAFLARPENRRCAKCGNPSTVVMHIKSIRTRPDLRMDKTNWRPGCHRCNAIEAAQERQKERN